MALRIDWLILADAAQLVGGKLYMLGGGWDVLTVNADFPVTHRCAVAAAFKVPWNDTNRQHNVELEIADQDGSTLFKVEGGLEVGRPPGIPQGHEQRAQLAVDLDLTFPGPGTYVIIARIEGEERARAPFIVVPGPYSSAPKVRPEAS